MGARYYAGLRLGNWDLAWTSAPPSLRRSVPSGQCPCLRSGRCHAPPADVRSDGQCPRLCHGYRPPLASWSAACSPSRAARVSCQKAPIRRVITGTRRSNGFADADELLAHCNWLPRRLPLVPLSSQRRITTGRTRICASRIEPHFLQTSQAPDRRLNLLRRDEVQQI
jgi:hypothetical protein